ncbi:hypothetical protein OJAV_G00000440 [Oryzias javanicus]|uniref:TNF family profile domain-containing protein n=1 Tax=Oryzias javanicus TaxID=123683 RepID=A0A3S2Q112_ORYJA|nr:hypothetical protein OJAV_G00000440 [Oryzias javanicus]
MGHQNKEVDEESLQARERVRSRRLDVFLIVSVLVLFLAVTALAVGGYVVVSALGSRPSPAEAGGGGGSHLKLSADAPSPAFKMHNFAYVELISSVVENKTAPWGPVLYGRGTSVGSNFDFNQEHHSLTPRQAGAYFIYIEVSLTCTHECSDGLLKLQVDDKLHCDVILKGDRRSVSKKCWTVAQLDGRGLVTQMRVDLPKPELTNWKLEVKGSGLGMFFIG